MLRIASFAVATGAKGNQSFWVVLIVPFVFADVVYFNPIRASTEGAPFPIPAAYFVAHFRPIFTIAAAGSIPVSFPRIGVKVIG